MHASPEEQRRHISELSLIQENADFDEPRVQEAIDWINEFLREGRGTGAHPGYTEKHEKRRISSIERMRQRRGWLDEEGSCACSPGDA